MLNSAPMTAEIAMRIGMCKVPFNRGVHRRVVISRIRAAPRLYDRAGADGGLPVGWRRRAAAGTVAGAAWVQPARRCLRYRRLWSRPSLSCKVLASACSVPAVSKLSTRSRCRSARIWKKIKLIAGCVRRDRRASSMTRRWRAYISNGERRPRAASWSQRPPDRGRSPMAPPTRRAPTVLWELGAGVIPACRVAGRFQHQRQLRARHRALLRCCRASSPRQHRHRPGTGDADRRAGRCST